MKDIILTQDKLIERRVKNNEGITSGIYFGDGSGKGALSTTKEDLVRNSRGEVLQSTVIPATQRWVGSEGYAKLWNEIEDLHKKCKNSYTVHNTNQFPDDYYSLVDRIRLDITRRRAEEMDFTSMLTQEVTNPNFSKSVNLNEFRPFAGAFKAMKGSGDSVNMLQQKTGEAEAVTMILYGLGHERSIEDELYNLDIYSLEKVNTAVARAHTALRNDLTIGQVVANSTAGTWAASQQVAADTTGVTIDEQMYITIREAVRTLGNLLDPQTGREINTSGAVLIVKNEIAAWDLNRVIFGNLNSAGAGKVIQLASLPVSEIWIYKGDTITVGPDQYDFAGVPDNTAYLCVPGRNNAPFWTLVKRQLTQEMGRGNVLTLGRERRAWHFAQTCYSKEWFGETALGATYAGSGYCVEITLPVYDNSDT